MKEIRELDKEGRNLCVIQAQIFEASLDNIKTSSPVFIRRFMLSELCREMDDVSFLNRPFDISDAFKQLDEEYGESRYGKEKYPPDELYWIGYIYRFWSYTYGISGKRAYRIASGRELHNLFLAYHALDPAHAVNRILEAKGLLTESDDISRGVEILRKLRAAVW